MADPEKWELLALVSWLNCHTPLIFYCEEVFLESKIWMGFLSTFCVLKGSSNKISGNYC